MYRHELGHVISKLFSQLGTWAGASSTSTIGVPGYATLVSTSVAKCTNVLFYNGRIFEIDTPIMSGSSEYYS